MARVTVVGAGMAGLLTAAMYRYQCNSVIEQAAELPNNHTAVLRFRSLEVAHALGVPFQKVKVMRCIHPWRNPVADMLAYSRKATGRMTMRSSVSASGEIFERYIAPSDLIARMGEMVKPVLNLGVLVSREMLYDLANQGPIISTIPMPILMKLLNYNPLPDFKYAHGCNITAEVIDCDAYCTIYVPDPELPFSRISITGNKLIIEFQEVSHETANDSLKTALLIAGIDYTRIRNAEVSPQRYAKILPISDAARKRFIIHASEYHKIYSVGRFATWRPGLLLDDVCDDVRKVHSMIENGHSYDQRKAG